jgi:hypothetical protein
LKKTNLLSQKGALGARLFHLEATQNPRPKSPERSTTHHAKSDAQKIRETAKITDVI